MAMRRRVLIVLALSASAVVGGVFACGQGAVGIDACNQIETARCQWIEQCFGGDGSAFYGLPTPRSDQASYVDDCTRYYKDACLHGLVSNVQPTTTQVSECVTAINSATDCTIVTNPETADACAFLLDYDAGDADSD